MPLCILGMNLQNVSPSEFKTLVKSLRSLPAEAAPGDLSARVMAALPRRRGFLGRVEYVLKRELTPHATRKSLGLLPSTPGEYGITLLFAGLFFLLLALTLVVAIHSAGLDGILAHALFALSPAMLGSILLVVAGWVQITSPRIAVQQNARFAVACSLFGLSAIIGLFSSGHYLVQMTAVLLGLSGLLIALGLFLIPKFSLTTREACYERKSCIA